MLYKPYTLSRRVILLPPFPPFYLSFRTYSLTVFQILAGSIEKYTTPTLMAPRVTRSSARQAAAEASKNQADPASTSVPARPPPASRKRKAPAAAAAESPEAVPDSVKPSPPRRTKRQKVATAQEEQAASSSATLPRTTRQTRSKLPSTMSASTYVLRRAIRLDIHRLTRMTGTRQDRPTKRQRGLLPPALHPSLPAGDRPGPRRLAPVRPAPCPQPLRRTLLITSRCTDDDDQQCSHHETVQEIRPHP